MPVGAAESHLKQKTGSPACDQPNCAQDGHQFLQPFDSLNLQPVDHLFRPAPTGGAQDVS